MTATEQFWDFFGFGLVVFFGGCWIAIVISTRRK